MGNDYYMGERIFSVTKVDGGFEWREECDKYFSETKSRDESIKIAEELLKFIKEA